jgi:two-component system, response regulator FlrC
MNQTSVLIVEDDSSLREAVCETLDLAGYPVTFAENGDIALEMIAEIDIGMVISDVQMKPMDGHALLKRIRTQRPDIPVLLMTAYGSIQKAVMAMQDGAIDYLVKPFEAEVLVNAVERYLPHDRNAYGDFIAVDNQTRAVMSIAERVAESDATVMITGESGSGKEVLARFIHNRSKRAEKPFVAINCAAIPDNMLEATLFGYEKGAFTGAYQACPGKFEQANGGTLLLDEISEMDLSLQSKLLRVLQEREVERLGGRKLIALDVRILATSNRKMRDEVNAGKFREDLFYRLNVFPLHLPPLRERTDDILPIARKLLEYGALRSSRGIPHLTKSACDKLHDHHWPGNVRELDNVIQRALILQNGKDICADDLQFETCDREPQGILNIAGVDSAVDDSSKLHLGNDLKAHEQQMIIETLRSLRGNRKATAKKLGISQRTLRYKLARMREEGVSIPAAFGVESA